MKFRHYKGGIYETIATDAKHSETEEKLVVYRSVHNNKVWIRPADMFFGTVEVEGVQKLRFEPIESA